MKLKELSIFANMKQIEVANRIGCSPVAYSRYERVTRQPDIATLWKLADLFGVSIDAIVGRTVATETAMQ